LFIHVAALMGNRCHRK